MTDWFVDNAVERPDHRCAHCRHLLAWVDGVGWVAVQRGDAYDLCEADAYGNHLAQPLQEAWADQRP
jgi:hypothetical protein